MFRRKLNKSNQQNQPNRVFQVVRAGAYIVLACNVIISYYHCLQLFNSLQKFPVTILIHIGVISLDAVFILSVIVLTESRGKGFPPWICFLFGLAFTTWSNIRPSLIEKNWEGIAVGASTVCALLLIKIMLTWMESNQHLFDRKSTNPDQSMTSEEKVVNSELNKSQTIQPIQEQKVVNFTSNQINTDDEVVNWKPNPALVLDTNNNEGVEKESTQSQLKVGPGNLILLKQKGVI